MAYDPRFSIGFSGSSGAGGAKLLRRNFGEQIESLAASSEYHWFAPNFLDYAGSMSANGLSADAHELMTLAAPRLLGRCALVDEGYPAVGELRNGARIAFRQHPDGHSNVPNWPAFLEFAARQWDLSN